MKLLILEDEEAFKYSKLMYVYDIKRILFYIDSVPYIGNDDVDKVSKMLDNVGFKHKIEDIYDTTKRTERAFL